MAAAAGGAGGGAGGAGAPPKYNFVISAHGNLLSELPLYPIPQNFSIHTPPLDNVLLCERKIQTEICSGTKALSPAYHFNGPINYKYLEFGDPRKEEDRDFFIDFDIQFTPDPPGSAYPFKTGLILCPTPTYDESIVVHEISKIITLRDILKIIKSYVEHDLGHNTIANKYNYNVQLTVLACTSKPNTNREVHAKAVPLPSGAGKRRKSKMRNRRKTRKTRKMSSRK